MKKVENKFFVIIIFIILLGGFIKPIIKPIDINRYENRPANKLSRFELKSFLSKNYQDNFEKALADQIPLSGKMKIFEKTFSLVPKLIYAKINKNKYNNLSAGIYLMNNNLVYKYKSLPSLIGHLKDKVENYNKISNEISDVDFYVYYIEKDTDINFENNEKLKAYEYIKANLSAKIKSDVFQVNNFDDFEKYFYKTDHHWNYKGSYKAYNEIAELLGITEPLIENKEKICLNSKLSGSKANSIGGRLLLKEQFCAYKFIFPEHKVYINNKLANSYGSYLQYYNNVNMPVSYGDFYGWDNGLIEFNYEDDLKENLLIIGESYDNAINELISAHFNKTFNIDLRTYKKDMNKDFDIKSFIKENKIDKVLLIGNIDYFTMEIFKLS